MTEPERLELMALITGARTDITRAQAALGDAVAHARKRGLSWADIGACLGISRQAAHQRFGMQAGEGGVA